MSFATKYNQSSGKFKLSTNGFEYRKLSECYKAFGEGHVYQIGAMFINTRNNYGPNPVIAVTDNGGFYVNLPSHLTNVCENMLGDEGTIADINKGICGFTIRTYTNYGKTCYGVKWVDVEVDENGNPVTPF